MLLGSAYGKVTLDASGVQNGVKQASQALQTLQTVGQSVGNAMKSVGNAMTIGITLPMIAAAGAAIKMASDLEETKNKVNVIFGDMSSEMLDWAETANTSLGQTRQQALDAASTFALFGKQAGLAGKDLVEFAQANTQLATDFASFFNTSPEEAIQAIGAAYRGETEPIRKYNILLNQQAIEAKALQLGLMSANGELSAQNKILAINALILEQSSAAQGDFARTSDGLANQSRILKAQLQDTLAELGENLLPMALKVVQALNLLVGAFAAMPEPMQNAILVLAGLVAAAGPVLSFFGTLLTTVSSLSAAWPAITAGATALAPALASVGTAITGVVLPALGGMVAAAGPVVLAIGLVIGAVALLYFAFKNNFMGITDTVKMLGFIIQFYAKKWWTDLTTNASKGLRSFGDTVKRAIEAVVKMFKMDWSVLGKNIIAGIIAGIRNGVGALVEAVRRAALAALQAAKRALGIRSPSSQFAYLGRMSGVGYVQGFAKTMQPDALAGAIARPMQAAGAQSVYTQTNNFASGLSLREARRMQAQSEKRVMKRTAALFGE